MAALFLLLILVAGFLHCHIHPVQKVCLHRYTGQYLYLRAAGYGVRALAVAVALALITIRWKPEMLDLLPRISAFLEHLGLGSDTPLQNAWMLSLSIGMFGVVCLHALAARLFYCLRYVTCDPSRHLTGKVLKDSPLDTLLYRLHLRKRMVMLSMADRKVYVGMIVSMGEPTETTGPDNEVLIIPMRSGYRDKDDLRVHFTTHYREFYDRQSADSAEKHPLTVVLRQKDIVSATEFSDRAYAFWNLSATSGSAQPEPVPQA